MGIFRRSRFLFWAVRELSQKYTKSLILGVILGFGLMVLLYSIFPFINALTFIRIQRIGLVGDYTPTNLPISIQAHMSYGLVTLAADGSLLPGLATSWEATDSGKQFLFHLRSDVLWHTGKPVAAPDINYNIRGAVFTPVDLYTLRVNLQSPFSPFPSYVARPIFTSNLIGFGQYKVNALRLKGDKIQLLRLVSAGNADLPTLEYRFYRSETQAITAYKLGEIDSIEGLSFVDPSLAQWNNTKITESKNQMRVIALYFNQKDTLMKEKSFRQAMAYAIPTLKNPRIYSPISESSWAYTDDVRHYDTDMGQAAKLLESVKTASQAGELAIHTFFQYLDIAQTIAQSWSALGLKTSVRVENVVPNEYQVLLSAQDIPADPDQYIYWHSTQHDTNITGFSNAKVDKLLEDGRTELDKEKRKKLYVDFQKKLADEIPAVFLYYPNVYSISRMH